MSWAGSESLRSETQEFLEFEHGGIVARLRGALDDDLDDDTEGLGELR